MENKGKVAIIGCGQIGHNFALMFAAAGYQVSICDLEKEKLEKSLEWIEETLKQLEQPVIFHKEILGFGINRLQYAIMVEAWRLTVVEKVITVADLEKLFTNGLGNRYAFCGPLGAQHINIDGGMKGHNKTYGESLHTVCRDFGQPPDFMDMQNIEFMKQQLEQLFPEETTEEFRVYKMKALCALAKLKKECRFDEFNSKKTECGDSYEDTDEKAVPEICVESKGKVAIIGRYCISSNRTAPPIDGSGMIGHSYALMFAAAGYNVCLHDISEEMLQKALFRVKEALVLLKKQGLARSNEKIDTQMSRITTSLDLESAMDGANFVMECVPERIELKRIIFEKIDKLVKNENVVVVSSTSNICPSKIMNGLKHKSQYLVCHPVSPPIYMPTVEIVPSQWTLQSAVDKTRQIVEEIGQVPAVIKKEIPGFVHNRLQYAIMAEAWRLAKNGILSAADADRLVEDGLGMRWAFIGPWENAMHNAYTGLPIYCHKFGAAMKKIAETQTEVPNVLDENDLDKIHAELEKRWPLSKIDEIREWRSETLAKLAKLKLELKKEHPLTK